MVPISEQIRFQSMIVSVLENKIQEKEIDLSNRINNKNNGKPYSGLNSLTISIHKHKYQLQMQESILSSLKAITKP